MHGRYRERKKHPAVYERNCGVITIEYGVVGLHGKLRLHCHRGIFLGGIDPRDAFATGKRVTPAGLPREHPFTAYVQPLPLPHCFSTRPLMALT